MSGNAVLENVRRYRTIASLCRQAAAFRPAQKWSLLAEAFEYERLALAELEGYSTVTESRMHDRRPDAYQQEGLRPGMAAAA